MKTEKYKPQNQIYRYQIKWFQIQYKKSLQQISHLEAILKIYLEYKLPKKVKIKSIKSICLTYEFI